MKTMLTCEEVKILAQTHHDGEVAVGKAQRSKGVMGSTDALHFKL